MNKDKLIDEYEDIFEVEEDTWIEYDEEIGEIKFTKNDLYTVVSVEDTKQHIILYELIWDRMITIKNIKTNEEIRILEEDFNKIFKW